MMRRTPLKRGTKPLRRTTRLRARGDTAYRRRERDVPRMLFVKRLPCILRTLPLAPFVSDTARAPHSVSRTIMDRPLFSPVRVQ